MDDFEPWTDWHVWTKISDDPVQHDWVFNHTERGHVYGEKPQPKDPSFKAQNQWANQTWWAEHCYRKAT